MFLYNHCDLNIPYFTKEYNKVSTVCTHFNPQYASDSH